MNLKPDSNKIVFQARRFHFVWSLCLLLLPPVLLVKIMEHGLFPLSIIFNYIIEGLGWLWLGMVLISFFIPFKNLTITVADKTLTAPLQGNLFFSKSIIVDLSDVVVSTSRRDWIHGFEISTLDGQGILISSLLCGRKEKKCIIKEIESRKAKLVCEKKEAEPQGD